MKLEYPVVLMEFTMAGVLLEVLFGWLLGPLEVALDLATGAILLSGAYALGLAANAIASRLFTPLSPRIRRSVFQRRNGRLEGEKETIKKLFQIDIDNASEDDKVVLAARINQYLLEVSPSCRNDHAYQVRLYRMSRTVFVVTVLWAGAAAWWWVTQAAPPHLNLSRGDLGLALAALLVAGFGLFLTALDRIQYIAEMAYERFSIVHGMREELIKAAGHGG